ncbi:hypothetical protein E2C01_093319 [Portunus trituberculatus]|uniref:Uncharacterized protein n=1 Tax=Portunus trituberculatus TaxID=210409 RepID=A0A5B7JPH2_PORTR|nr:hypothetical protein [Portunus trituberculatus]
MFTLSFITFPSTSFTSIIFISLFYSFHPISNIFYLVLPSQYPICLLFLACTTSLPRNSTPSSRPVSVSRSSVPSSRSIVSYSSRSTSLVSLTVYTLRRFMTSMLRRLPITYSAN